MDNRDFIIKKHSSSVITRRNLMMAAGVGMMSTNGFSKVGEAQGLSEVDEIWNVEFEGNGTQIGVQPPTVLDNTVYVIEEVKGHIYALDASNGDIIWNKQTLGRIPSVVNGIVFTGNKALKSNTGEQLWNSGEDGVPTVADNKVFVNGKALNATTGEEVWNSGENGVPTVADNKVFVNGKALDPSTGEEIWDSSLDNPGVTFADGTVIANSGDYIYAIDSVTGDEKWRWSHPDGLSGNTIPTVVDNKIYVTKKIGSSAKLIVLNLNGNEQVVADIPNTSGLDPFSAPTVSGNIAYVNGFARTYGINTINGEIEWKYYTRGGNHSPIVVDGTLYVSSGFSLYALDTSTSSSSEGSRVNLGTVGHHHKWAEKQAWSINISPDPSISQSSGTVSPSESVAFDAGGSVGLINSYDWQFGDGTTATGTSVSHTYDQSDTYTVTLTTTGQDGTTATTSTEVAVAQEGELTFSIQPESPAVGQSITFEATGADSYEWEFGDDATASGHQVTHTFETENTYTVTLSSPTTSVSRDIQVAQTPVTITNISREFGGVPLQAIPYEDTFYAAVDSDNQLETVEFELGGQTKTASNIQDTPEATFDLSSLDESSVLTVTATDTDGFVATSQQTVAITPIPEWMEWLVETADIGVDLPETQIDITHNPLDLSGYSFSLGDIPIDTTPPGFDSANAGAEVAYDTSQQAAVVEGDGGVDTELFGYGFEAELDIEGAIDSELDLVDASGAIAASVSGQVGPPLYVTVPPGVPCLDEQLGIETTIAPGITLEADFDGEFDLQKGTVTPETELTVGTELDICGTGAGAEVSGTLDASFDVGTASRNLTGTISGEGDAWVDVSILEAEIDVGFEVVLPAESEQVVASQTQPDTEHSWSVTNKRGAQPAISVPTVDAEPTTTAAASPLAPTADGSTGYQRLTDRPLEDTHPAMTTIDGETLVMWSSQREGSSATAGRDIAYRLSDGTGWSTIQYLTTETQSHEAPAVATSNGTILAAWEHVTTNITEETEPADIHPHIEIAYAIYDGETWSDPTVLTDTGNREFQPTVAPTADGWLIGWEQETDPTAGVGQRNVRYTTITTAGTVNDTSTISGAMYPDTGAHPERGAVLGYASRSDGETTAAVSTRIVDGAETDSQQFNASAVRSLTVGSDRLIWQEGEVDAPTLVEANRGTSGTEQLVVRDAVTAVAEPSLSTDGKRAVLSYRAYVETAETRELVYRLNRGSGWIFDRQFVQAPAPTQTVWQPETTFGTTAEQFKTAFAISETSQTGKNDIFLAEHDFLPEYAIAADGPSDATAGETVTLEYDLRNRGDIDGTQSVTVTVSNTAGTQANKSYTGLAAGETISDSVTVSVDETGEFELAVSTAESSLSTAAATSGEFEAETTTVRVATPQLRVEEITTASAETVGITVSNSGGATAFNVPLRVTDGEAELTNTTVEKLRYGEATTVTVTIDPRDIDRSSEDTVELDPDKTLPAAVSDSARTTPTWLLQPDLRVTEEIGYRRGTVGQIIADVIVGNRSPVEGTATLEAITADGSVVGETSVSLAGTEQGSRYTTISVRLAGSVSEADELRFRIAPTVPDADPSTLSRESTVGPVLESDQSEAQVTLLNTTLSDEPVDATPDSHTLQFTAENVSADNSSDSFAVELPDAVTFEDDDVENVTVTNGDYDVSPSVTNNTISFDVNPASDNASVVDLDIEVDMNLSANESS